MSAVPKSGDGLSALGSRIGERAGKSCTAMITCHTRAAISCHRARRSALPKKQSSKLPRIGTSGTRINFWYVWSTIGLRRRQGIGTGVHLGTGRLGTEVAWTRQLVVTRVTLQRWCAARLPTATALAATPSRRAGCGWRNISHRRT